MNFQFNEIELNKHIYKTEDMLEVKGAAPQKVRVPLSISNDEKAHPLFAISLGIWLPKYPLKDWDLLERLI